MVRYVHYTHEGDDGLIHCHYFDIFGTRTLVAWSESVWYTKDKMRKIPIWIDRKGLFIGKLAVKTGKRKE